MSHEGICIYPERIEEVVGISIQAMKNKEGLFAFADPQPERHFVELTKSKGPEFALNALFLISPMIIESQTEPFVRRISTPELFEANCWLFDPKEVAKHTQGNIIESCNSYFHPSGRQPNTVREYFYNCKKIADCYGGLVSNYFKKYDNDAKKIYDALIIYPGAKTPLKEIRRFGPKVGKLFIQWVREYGLYDLQNTDEVGVPVDFQLSRVSIQTNGLTLDKPVGYPSIHHKLLPLIFENLVQKGYRPEDISKALWTIGSVGCKYGKHALCPIENLCTSLISFEKYSKKGIYDPQDVGRYK